MVGLGWVVRRGRIGVLGMSVRPVAAVTAWTKARRFGEFESFTLPMLQE